MLQHRKLKLTRRGAISALVALLIVILLGVTAFAIDGGMLQDNKRRLQATADASALAAAAKLFQNYPTILSSNTADPGGQAATVAKAIAKDNGFEHNGNTVKVFVNIPPATGPFAGKFGYAEVAIEYKQPRYFSTVWGSDAIVVSARSVAIGMWKASKTGILVLDLTAAHALDDNGSGSLTVTGGASVIVNSNDPEAAARASGGGYVVADNFYVVGGVSGNFTGNIITGGQPQPDPLAYLPEPSQPPDGVMTTVNLPMGNKQYTFTPGRYTGFPNFNTGDIAIFKQASAGNGGIYYLENTGFTSQGATLSMDPTTSGGVMFYNKTTGGTTLINYSDNGTSRIREIRLVE